MALNYRDSAIRYGDLTIAQRFAFDAGAAFNIEFFRSMYGGGRIVLPASDGRIHDAPAVGLPAAATADDLGCVSGTFLTAKPLLQAGDVGTLNSTRYGRWIFQFPFDATLLTTLTLRAKNAGMLTTVAGTSCSIDAQVVDQLDPDAELCTTALQSINSLTLADKDFTIGTTTLVANSVLDIRIAVAYVDAGDAGVMIPTLDHLELIFT